MYVQLIIKRTLLALFAVAVFSYTVLKLTPLISGPEVIIISSISDTKNNLIKLSGMAKRVKELKVFDKVVAMSESGEFTEYIIKHDPYTTIIISATDKWGKSKEIKININ